MLHKSSVRTQWNGLRTSLVRNPFISLEIIDPKFVINMPVDAIASSRLIYATTPQHQARRPICSLGTDQPQCGVDISVRSKPKPVADWRHEWITARNTGRTTSATRSNFWAWYRAMP
ncbi:MAG: hypothetical protein VB140_01625 [Burkholderia sp.]